MLSLTGECIETLRCLSAGEAVLHPDIPLESSVANRHRRSKSARTLLMIRQIISQVKGQGIRVGFLLLFPFDIL